MADAVTRLLGLDAENRPRADARRNVQRLVEAARIAVAEVGVTVTAHEIARRAGVGIGTFYRRLPSRDALLEAVLTDTIDELIATAESAREDPDPRAAFCAFAETFVQLRAASCGINEALGGSGHLKLDASMAELRRQFKLLVRRAQQAAVLRSDISWQDVPFLLAGAVSTDHTIGLRADDQQWRRNLQIILDGLQQPTPRTASDHH
jgi:AcrR family transcriptional regulator